VVSISPASVAGPSPASPSQEDAAKAGVVGGAAQRPPLYDGWEIDEQLRHFGRVLGPGSGPRGEPGGPVGEPKLRLDAGHGVPAAHLKRVRRSSRKTKRAVSAAEQPAPRNRVLAVLAWMALWLGTTGSVCGLALIGWSISTGQRDLWTVGTPIILAGQVFLILGLVLELDRIWRDNRWAGAKLETVDEQLHDLKKATTLLGTAHGPSGPFYAHWAGGAGPEILLGDLKGQLDLLAEKLSRQ
jgi:hypothetical protein